MMAEPPKVLKLMDIEALPGPGTLTWRPVRHALGVRASGCNAYTAHDVGADVVEPHTEGADSDLWELYFVASGHALFTIDGRITRRRLADTCSFPTRALVAPRSPARLTPPC